MKIEIPERPDPQSNIIQFTRAKRESSLVMERKKYDDCKHERTIVHEATRTVTCASCGTLLDAFQVLWEMAVKERLWLQDIDAWEARRDSMLSERYDLQWAERAGDVTQPPEDKELLKIWETFHAVFGDKFCGMYRRRGRKRAGPEWYGRDTRGCCVSLEYARSVLVQRIGVMKSNVKQNEPEAGA